jgi:hypothetical protein
MAQKGPKHVGSIIIIIIIIIICKLQTDYKLILLDLYQ